ncbi:MAG: leucine-rich repeat domain-containing protein, partial [Ureaplasma sp.]|nr:leucine-rich repeat domain-containing protein [Ureaplasma sp.]
EQFLAQINSNTFKGKIATYLGIDVNAIGNIEFDNNTLTIFPNSMYKFKSSTDNELIDDNGIIHVSNFTFFNLYDIVNLNNLFTGINTYIAQTNKQYTEEQFANDVITNPDSIKTVIASNLQLQLGDTTQNATVENIKTVTYNSTDHQLEITLSDNYFKYQQTAQDDNVSLNGDKVIVSNLEFFSEITFNSADLTTLRTNIQNLINENQINSNNISSYLSNQIYNLVKDINTISNGSLEQYITTPTYSSNTINIPLKLDVGLYKFKSTSLSNIVITSNQISLNSVTLFTPPTPSPVNWFTWDGTKITGLSSLGEGQSIFILPAFTTELDKNLFNLNTKITSIDMSLTQITILPDNDNGSLFNGCTNLSNVVLPNNLEIIGRWVFWKCSSLKTIRLPDSLVQISRSAFHSSGLTTINLPSKLQKLDLYAFYSCSSLKSVNNLMNTKITIISEYLFYGCNNLESIYLPSNIETIESYSFYSCSKLKSISLPNKITSIGNYSFYRCLSLQEFNFPSELKSIGNYAFDTCSALKNIVLPEKLNFIGNAAFANPAFSDIILPNSITNIGKNVFDNWNASSNSWVNNINLVVYVNSVSVENILKPVYSGIIINFNRP